MEPRQEDQTGLESRPGMSETWFDIIAEAAFPEEGRFTQVVNRWHVLIARTDEGLFAINNRCTHQGSTLSPGRMRKGAIVCPLHGAWFFLNDGRCLGGAYPNVRTFPLRIEGGMISVAVPDQAPTIEELPAPISAL